MIAAPFLTRIRLQDYDPKGQVIHETIPSVGPSCIVLSFYEMIDIRQWFIIENQRDMNSAKY
jgi:hypothetical protein